VGNNTPVFFIRDGIKFPDFIHSQKKYDPHTNRQEPDNIWDFFSLSPEATHQFTWLFGDRGIPASYRQGRSRVRRQWRQGYRGRRHAAAVIGQATRTPRGDGCTGASWKAMGSVIRGLVSFWANYARRWQRVRA
jgi:hypothetical protein